MTHATTNDLDTRGSDLLRTLTVLAAWFLLAVWLGLRGTLGATGKPPLALAVAMGVPLLLFALEGRLGRPLFRGLQRLDLASLIALQTFRVGGVFFVVAWLGGSLPAAFALPAGLGDLAVGLTAPLVAAAVANRAPRHRAVALAWSVAGLADLFVAVSLGVTHSSSSLGVFASSLRTDALARYPFSLIPTFLVPLAIMLHVLGLRALTRPRAI
jgi:hypothetical protein